MSTEPTWRAYLTEWLTVWTSDALEVMGQRECRDVFARKYEGRVRPEDMRIRSAGPLRPSPQALQLRLPNLRGEYKDYGDAVALASDLMDGHEAILCVVVQRGSSEERSLLDYSKKMLPGAG
jgi:hypothetical protein